MTPIMHSSLQVADTVVVAESGPAEVLTRFSGATWNDVSYVIKEEEDAGDSEIDELDNLRDSSQRRRCGFFPVRCCPRVSL
jgi:hypothetical protein